MKPKLVIFNILLLGFIIPFIGGGAFAKLGYFFLLGSLICSILFFPNIAIKSLFNNATYCLYAFLLFFLISSNFDLLGCVAIFGRICPPIFFFLIYNIIKGNNHLIRCQRNFIIIWLLAICFFEFQALKFLSDNPMGLRELVSSKKDESLIVGGGFSLPYSLCILVPSLILYLKLNFSKNTKTMFIIFSIFFAYLVISAMYMTAIIIMLSGIALALIHGYSFSKKVILTCIISIIAIVSYDFIPYLIKEYAPEDTNVLINRFNEIDSILDGNDVSESEDFYSRILLSLKSIKTFIHNPLIGIGWKYNYDFFEMEKAGVGSHAQWFDIFASYGLFAILLIAYLKISSIKSVTKDNLALTLFIIIGFLNPCLQFTIVFTAYCLIPLIRICYLRQKYNTNQLSIKKND